MAAKKRKMKTDVNPLKLKKGSAVSKKYMAEVRSFKGKKKKKR